MPTLFASIDLERDEGGRLYLIHYMYDFLERTKKGCQVNVDVDVNVNARISMLHTNKNAVVRLHFTCQATDDRDERSYQVPTNLSR